MAVSRTNQCKALKRIERRSTVRQSLFASEYVKCKYPDIFNEAGLLYNELNGLYPKKPDLRKCYEFKRWKNNIAVEQGQESATIRPEKPYIYTRVEYNNIVLNPVNEPPPENRPQKVMELNIELMTPPPPHGNNVHETVIEESSHPATPEEHPSGPFTPEESPDEPLEQSVEPFKPLDEIAPEIITKIVNDLRLDPQLSALMDDVESQIQEQTVGLEVDIPELDLITDEDDIFW